ncbi:MAG: aspartate--tRNA ligase [Planctomycetes bacterium]|nr:aspartate--tRNA ligase [Planctomycetota bacterium]
MFTLKRTHTCGALRAADAGSTVNLNGWVEARRDHGGVLFVDLRDRYGKTQVVFRPESGAELLAQAQGLRAEFVLAVQGVVKARPAEAVKKGQLTGEIELEARKIEILNEAKVPPFEVTDDLNASDELRLKYRYLDLRRRPMQQNMITRHRIIAAFRESMDRQGFLDLDTPVLIKNTPGGARNFLVPSRLQAGNFFALAESPQIFKQLFQVAGIDRYFQVCKCFRDEDLRADRQPEFSQFDLEMSFVDESDVQAAVEDAVGNVFKKVLGVELKRPFPKMSYAEAMDKYGSDKPDIRFGMHLVDVSDLAKASAFRVFSEAVATGGVVKGLCVVGGGTMSRKDIDELTTWVKGVGAKGLVWLKGEGGTLGGGSAKNFTSAELSALRAKLAAKDGDLLLFVADEKGRCKVALGGLRTHLGAKLKLIKEGSWEPFWVEEFPMFEAGPEGRPQAKHHVFTSPKAEDLDFLEKDPLRVRARAYDLVLNGVELGGGSIRIHRKDVQRRVLAVIGLEESDIRDKFGFMLDAFDYGAPPHGGIALGVDRFVMLLLGLDTIRDVIPYPKTQKGQCLMQNAPSGVIPKQLDELHIALKPPPPAEEKKT